MIACTSPVPPALALDSALAPSSLTHCIASRRARIFSMDTLSLGVETFEREVIPSYMFDVNYHL